MNKNVWRGVTEVGFIIFLSYSNLLMGEFTRSVWEGERAWHGLLKIFLPTPTLPLP
jgi:hypothetical protein